MNVISIIIYAVELADHPLLGKLRRGTLSKPESPYDRPIRRWDLDVCFGSKADICAAKSHVRFASESGHVRCSSSCPLSANSGHRETCDVLVTRLCRTPTKGAWCA